MSNLPLKLTPAVAAALRRGDPVVALESTIISHGMPYPQNVETARVVEDIVRAGGAVPATIAILDGVIHIGLSDEALDTLGRMGHACQKTSRRDIAVVIAKKGTGATTVAATMYLANLVGIRVFVTGGIGGVHKGGETSLDVSADLTELGRTPVAVVCAGAKSILDIGLTLEYLETQGVTVVGYQTDDFPAFFSRSSGHQASCRADSPAECARFIDAAASAKLESGMVIGVPVPREDEADASTVEAAIASAIRDAERQGIHGRELTPFLLAAINEKSGGKSLMTNIALVKNNARVGARIASELAALRRGSTPVALGASKLEADGRAVVVGGVVVDMTLLADGEMVRGTSNPGRVTLSPGGVGYNITRCFAQLQSPPLLISACGDDVYSQYLLKDMQDGNIDTRGIVRLGGQRTAMYAAVLDDSRGLLTAVADMSIFDHITPDLVSGRASSETLARAPVIVVDANVPEDTLAVLGKAAHQSGTPLAFEPVSTAKCAKITAIADVVTVMSPNEDELPHILASLNKQPRVLPCVVNGRLDMSMATSQIEAVFEACRALRIVLLTVGSLGCVMGCRGSTGLVVEHTVAPKLRGAVQSVTGAGDTLLASFLWAHYCQKVSAADSLRIALEAARLTVESPAAVSPLLNAGIAKRSNFQRSAL